MIEALLYLLNHMALSITICARPGSSHQKISVDSQGTIKIFVTSQPEKGKANDEIISFLAKTLSCAKKEITIISGYTSKTKKVVIASINTLDELFRILKLDRQINLP
jgi:uncharacterized protein (TIGR00251 family)